MQRKKRTNANRNNEDQLMSVYNEMYSSMVTQPAYNKIKKQQRTTKRKRESADATETSLIVDKAQHYLFQRRKLKSPSKRRRTSNSLATQITSDDGVYFPRELIIHFLSYLPVCDLLCKVRCVCKEWKALVDEDCELMVTGHDTLEMHLNGVNLNSKQMSNQTKSIQLIANRIMTGGQLKHLNLANCKSLPFDQLHSLLYQNVNSEQSDISKLIHQLQSINLLNCSLLKTKFCPILLSGAFDQMTSLAISFPSAISTAIFPNLRVVDWSYSQLSYGMLDDCLRNCKYLQEIYLRETLWTRYDYGFAANLNDFESALHTIDLSSSRDFNFKGLFNLLDAVGSLRNIYLSDCSWLYNVHIQTLGDKCPDLRRLSIGGCPNVTDDSMRKLTRNCTELQYLNLSSTATSLHTRVTCIQFQALQELNLSQNLYFCKGDVREVVKTMIGCIELHATLRILNCLGFKHSTGIKDWAPLLRVYSALQVLICETGQYHSLAGQERSAFIRQYAPGKSLTSTTRIWVNALNPADYLAVVLSR